MEKVNPTVTTHLRTLQSKTLPEAFRGLFPTTLPCAPLAVAVQLDPQAKPVGQQPPPFELAQLDHPVPQVSAGAAIVTPFVAKRLVLNGGQEVVSQFRPV